LKKEKKERKPDKAENEVHYFSYSAMDEYFNKCKKNAIEYLKNIERVVTNKDVGFILGEKNNKQETNSFPKKRTSERVYIRIPVYVYTENSIYMDYSVDISEGGIGIESLEPLEKGKRVNLTLYFSSENQLNAGAEVAWSAKENINKTVGFCFKDLSPDVKNYLINLILTSKNKQPNDV
jgi:hypothetical protein